MHFSIVIVVLFSCTLTFSLIFERFSINPIIKVDYDYFSVIYLSRNGFETKSNQIA